MYYKIKHFIGDILFWFEICFNRYHFNVVWQTLKSMPYDATYTWKIEKARLIELKRYFIYSSDTFDHENDIKWINICIRLLDILIGDGFSECYVEGENSMDLVFIKYVNIKNLNRFIPFMTSNECCHDSVLQLVYMEKVKNLYYEIIKNNIYSWGD